MSFRKAELPIDLSSKAVFGMEYDRDRTDHDINGYTGKSMYGELMEMGAISMSVYIFGILREVARKAKKDNIEFMGFKFKTKHETAIGRNSILRRTYTPQELKQLVLKNIPIINRYYPSVLSDESVSLFIDGPLDILLQMTVVGETSTYRTYTSRGEGLPVTIGTRGQEKSIYEESWRTLESINDTTNKKKGKSLWKKTKSLSVKKRVNVRAMSFQELWHPLNQTNNSSTVDEKDPLTVHTKSGSVNDASNEPTIKSRSTTTKKSKNMKLSKAERQKSLLQDQTDFESTRPLTFQEYDDDFQRKEVVYGVVLDRINKRVVLVFRGTDTALSGRTNWSANVDVFIKERVTLPEYLTGKVDIEDIECHGGYYDYLFEETVDENDRIGMKKFDEILLDIQPLLSMNPDYELYVTGHSLGGSVSTIAAFYLSCMPNIPKPVKNISFCAPRSGGRNFLKATQVSPLGILM